MAQSATDQNKQPQNDDAEQKQQQSPSTDSNKVIIVLTGATGSIGGSIATELASKPNTSLHLLARNENKIKTFIQSTLTPTMHKTSTVNYHIVDLSSKASLTSFITNFSKTYSYLDILINNAAIVPSTYQQTEDKEELQFAVNVMSYMRLMNGLLPLLIKSGKDQQRRSKHPQLSKYGTCAKIVNVASQYTTKLSMDPANTFNLSAANGHLYGSNKQYKKCKAANRMLSYKAAEVYNNAGYNIGVYSLHPGVVSSNVLGGLGMKWGWDSANTAAKTPLYLALNAAVGLKQSGSFFVKCKPKSCEYCKDEKRVQKIWDYCMSIL